MKKQMDVHFHGALENGLWRGQVIGHDGELKARTGNLFMAQQDAIDAARRLWVSLQQQLRAVKS
jgi:hypothetical protein